MDKIYSFKDSNFKSKNHIIFICDHATNNFPSKYRYMTPEESILNSHLAYDIGAKNLSLSLSKKLNQSYFFSNFSRLIIDPNRSKNDSDLIVSKNFNINTTLNTKITKEEKKDRIKNLYHIYHDKLEKLIRKKTKEYKKLFLISIHSFTKKTQIFNRAIEVGLLWNENISLLTIIQKKLLKKKYSFRKKLSLFRLSFQLHTG